MDRNRKILLALLGLLAFSIVLAIVDISMSLQRRQEMPYSYTPTRGGVGPGVAIVRIDGPITMYAGQGAISSTEAAIQRLDSLSRDWRVKAVVLRINSPGGTVSGTQELYQKIWKLRKKNIPIIASMGEVAASGGYYIAAGCNKIVANHGTLTGSIGVIIMSPNLRRLFEKLGITMQVIKSGKYKDILSSYREMSTEERLLIQQIIDSSFNKFVSDIALGRNMRQDKILPYADGRIFSGKKALEIGLVDKIGTFEEAIDYAREIAKLDDDSPIYDDIKSPFQQFLLTMESMTKGGNLIEQNFNISSYNIIQYRYIP